MKLSVIIPTLGREQVVIDTIQGLLSQSRPPDEILIVDQNDPAMPELERFLPTVPIVRHIRSEVKGVVFNMNIGLAQARGDVVLFVDDDIVPDSRLVEAHLEVYADDPNREIAGVAGRVEQPAGDLLPEEIPETGQYHRWSGAVVAHFNSRRREDVMIAPGGNMSFRRDRLIAAGGFDLGFDGNSYFFEPDVCLRVIAPGHRLVFEPKADVKHLAAPSGGARIHDKAVHNYYFVKNGVRLYRRHSPTVGLPFFVLRMLAYSGAKAAYNGNPRIFARAIAAVRDGLSQPLELRNNALGNEVEGSR